MNEMTEEDLRDLQDSGYYLSLLLFMADMVSSANSTLAFPGVAFDPSSKTNKEYIRTMLSSPKSGYLELKLAGKLGAY